MAASQQPWQAGSTAMILQSHLWERSDRKWSHKVKHGQACCQKCCLDGRTSSDPSQQLWQGGRTGKVKLEGYLGISQDIHQITGLDIRKDILGYYKDIPLRYHLDISGYTKMSLRIS